MPRSFDMATDYECTVQQVHEAFCDRQYWTARLAASGVDDWTLNSFQVGDDGGLDVPGVVQQFHHGDLEIRRAETWTALSEGTARASVAGSIARAPVAVNGEASLSAVDGRARLVFQAAVEVRIPLVGGKMEKFIGAQLIDLLNTEQEFTIRWIGDGDGR
jgi:hypothetical protein